MKLVSWNVNGIRACLKKGFLDFFNEIDADIFCIQETKASESQVEIKTPGYKQFWNSAEQKGYSGTLIFTKSDPINSINETLKDSVEVLKRLPNLPEVMDKANQALNYLASGQIPQNSNSYNELTTKKEEMKSFRNQSIIGLLSLVILTLLVF